MTAWLTAHLAALWAKAGTWLALAGAVIAAVFAALLWGEHKGKQVGVANAAKQVAKDAQASQQATKTAASVRAEVESASAGLPDAPAQKVADADPATAAGKLRDEGWTRD